MKYTQKTVKTPDGDHVSHTKLYYVCSRVLYQVLYLSLEEFLCIVSNKL